MLTSNTKVSAVDVIKESEKKNLIVIGKAEVCKGFMTYTQHCILLMSFTRISIYAYIWHSNVLNKNRWRTILSKLLETMTVKLLGYFCAENNFPFLFFFFCFEQLENTHEQTISLNKKVDKHSYRFICHCLWLTLRPCLISYNNLCSQ